MNSLIETLNHWGGRIPGFAWPMLWQSSVLIAALFVFDLAARRKVRASVRYALWLVVLVKLLLPPTLALPTSLAWWVRPPAPPPKAQARTTAFVVTYGDFIPANLAAPAPPVFVAPPKPSLSGAGRAAATWTVVGAGLLAWLVARWRRVAGDVHKAMVAPELLNEVLDEAQHGVKLPRRVRLLVTERAMSPAVCGLFRPVILLPQSLVERLTPSQLRAVLLHELAHLRRGDVWVNCAQALLQIFYWWHPLLWLANARIRRVREEAVDDAVMLALRDDAETYAPTLLEVAKLAFNRPLASLGLVGILESRSALRQRIERLVDFRPPRKAGLTIVSALCVVAFAALAVPMEQAPATRANQVAGGSVSQPLTNSSIDKVESPARKDRIAANTKVADGRILFEAGKFDEAEAELKKAIAIDPKNRSAFYYLNLVKEARYRDAERRLEQDFTTGRVEIEPTWSAPVKREALPVLNPYATTNLIFTGRGRQAIISKLGQIRLDSVSFKRLPLGEVVTFLNDEARRRDPEQKGIHFMIDPNAATASPTAIPQTHPTTGLPVQAAPSEPADISTISINLDPPLHDVRLADVMEAIVRVANKPIKYSMEDYAVVFSRRGPEAELLYTRTFQVDPKAFYKRLEGAVGISLDDGGSGIGKGGFLTMPGVDPQEAERIQNPRTLPPDLPQTRDRGGMTYITRTNPMHLVNVAVATFFRSLGVDLASPNALALGKSVFWKDRIGTLLVRATKEDLDAIGHALADLEAKPQSAINAIGPPTAVMTNKSARESSNRLDQARLEAIKDKVPVLGDIPLVGKLFRSEANAFRAEAFGTSNSPAASAGRSGLAAGPAVPLPTSSSSEPLQVRNFRVNPNSFYKSLESVGSFHRTNINAALRDFLVSLGVDLSPPKNIFWNERNGGLLVRATAQDLDVIEKAIEVLSLPSPQINIKARFVEIEQKDTHALGFDWYLGNLLMANGGGTNSVGKASPQLQGVLTDPQFRVVLRALEQRVGKTSPQLQGVLTDPQFRVVLRALEQQNGADILDAPEVTTVSGLQAQVQVVDIQTVVTGINPQAQLPPGIVSTNGLMNSLYQTQTMPFGPVLDVIPYLAADGYTINMTVIPTVTEFLGYDNPAIYGLTNSTGQLDQVLPLPHFRVRQMTVTADVRDGQTLMLIGTVTTEVLKKPDGSTETKDVSDTQKKQLIVFITPTLIDPAGNRLHGDDESAPGPK